MASPTEAIGSILRTLPKSYVGGAILEVEAPEDFLALATDAHVAVTWLARSTRRRGQLLAQAVREVMSPGECAAGVPDLDPDHAVGDAGGLGLETAAGSPYVWIAGEASVVKELRRYLVGEVACRALTGNVGHPASVRFCRRT